MDQPTLNQQQEQSLLNKLKRGENFFNLINQEGWKDVQAYYLAKVQDLATTLMTDSRPIIEFENERQRLIGLKELFSFINSDVEAFKHESETAKPAGK